LRWRGGVRLHGSGVVAQALQREAEVVVLAGERDRLELVLGLLDLDGRAQQVAARLEVAALEREQAAMAQ
jgi:hypothetical protein